MALTRQQKWYYFQRNYKQQRSAGASTSYSDEAQAAFALYDSLGDGLTDSEKAAMAVYIDAEVAAGNHAKKDYEAIFSLSGTNALVDYIGGKVATNNGATLSINGATFAGAEYIDTNYNPSTDATNYALNSIQFGGFFTDVSGFTTTKIPIGYAVGIARAQIITNPTDYFVTAASSNGYQSSVTPSNDQLIYSIDNGAGRIVANGVTSGNVTLLNRSIANETFYVGARNNGGVADVHVTGSIASFLAGGVLVDQGEHYANILTLLTSLGTI